MCTIAPNVPGTKEAPRVWPLVFCAVLAEVSGNIFQKVNVPLPVQTY